MSRASLNIVEQSCSAHIETYSLQCTRRISLLLFRYFDRRHLKTSSHRFRRLGPVVFRSTSLFPLSPPLQAVLDLDPPDPLGTLNRSLEVGHRLVQVEENLGRVLDLRIVSGKRKGSEGCDLHLEETLTKLSHLPNTSPTLCRFSARPSP